MTATRMSDRVRLRAAGDRADGSRSARDTDPPRYPAMVRILHVLMGEASPNCWILCAAILGLAGYGVVVAGCGPISADRPESRPPYIDPAEVNPAQRVIKIIDADPETVKFSVTALDPNREELLNSVWATESELLADSELSRTNRSELNGEQFFEYDPAAFELDPCRIAEGGENETIWLYIADRQFQSISPTQGEIRVRSGGFIVSRSWVLSLSPSACSGSL